ncbi:MAG: hypothetical protein ACOYOS_25255 [Syntrophales bacterium]
MPLIRVIKARKRADLIQKKSREIAGIFGIFVDTVPTHRNKIRKKLGLKPKDANLRPHLLFLAQCVF